MKKIIFLFIFTMFAFGAGGFSPSLGVFYDESKAAIGKKLFFDKRLSLNGKKSCETCHNLYWDFSGTIRKNINNNTINPPSVLNSALNYIFLQNGSIKNIYDQVQDSITSDIQLDIDEKTFVFKLTNISDYRLMFSKVYSDGITFKNAIDALVEFQRAVLAVSSPFDRFLMGDNNAIGKDEKLGFETFKSIGCVACHNGVNLGSNILQKMGFYKDFLDGRNFLEQKGQKLYKVPSLRNIARTAPYMSDGSILYLKDAIIHVADTQLMHKISKEQIDLIYKFLLTLNGEYPRILK